MADQNQTKQFGTPPEKPANPDNLSEGMLLASYRLVERIGQGGEAEVWSAWDARTQRIVAIKIIHDRSGLFVPGPQFTREAYLVARLTHPNLVPLYDFGQWSSVRFMVMRYMVGGSLSRLIHQGPLPPAEVAQLAVPIAATLDYIHSSYVVHRDLKPANILLDTCKVPYLSDFGLARQLSAGTTLPMHSPEGTVPYMPPEQLRGEIISAQSDLFSFGVMLFEMFTGELPLEGRACLAVSQQQTGQPLEDPAHLVPSLPPGLVGILRELTSDKPADRPISASDAVQRINGLFDLSSVNLISDQVETGIFRDPDKDQLTDVTNLLQTALKTWTPDSIVYPFRLTEMALIMSVLTRTGSLDPLPPRTAQLLLYGALQYGRSADIDACWAAAPEAARQEICWAMILQFPIEQEGLILPRVLALAMKLEPVSPLPANVQNRLIAISQLNRPPVSGQALDLLVRWSGPISAAWREHTTPLDTLLASLLNGPLASQALAAAIRTRSVFALHSVIVADQSRARRMLIKTWFVARSLPPHIPRWLRAQVLVRIGVRQLTDRPLVLLADFGLFALACSFALGLFIFLTFRAPEFLSSVRILNGLSVGLMFGIQMSIGLMATRLIAERLTVMFPVPRLALATILGGLITAWAFVNFHQLYYHTAGDSPLLLPGALIFVLGATLASVEKRLAWRITLTGLGVLLALALTWTISLNTGNDPLIFLDGVNPFVDWFLFVLFATTIGIVSQSGGCWRRFAQAVLRAAEAREFTGRDDF